MSSAGSAVGRQHQQQGLAQGRAPLVLDATDPVAVTRAFTDLGPDALRQLGRDARRLLADDGVTYRPVGRGDEGDDRWRLDPIPLVLGPDEWARIDAGVVQRAELLNLVLADLYGPRELLRSGVLPPEVVYGHPGFLRALDGVRNPGFHQLTVCATDLVRDTTGAWRPLSDRTQVPSGAAYALQNRSAAVRLVPELHRAAHVERLAPYVRALRAALRGAAPPHAEEPRIALLTAGSGVETAFEHAHLAGLLGYPMVEGADLAVRDGRVWLRALGGDPAPLDVLLRRVDAWWCDPLELRPDSALGAPGLVQATRSGGVSIVNHLGAGVLENAALQAFMPTLASRLLGQELRLPPARSLWCGDDDARAEVLARLDELVVKPIARTGPDGALDVSQLSAAERATLRERILAHPHRFVGQERLDGERTPSVAPDGHLVAGRTVLRTFVVARGDSYTALRGGLTRVADGERLTIATTVGAWSKDTWVLGGDHEVADGFWLQEGPRVAAELPEAVVSARAVENLLWLGRYAERAEATVRLMRAIDDRRNEAGGGTPALDAVVDRLLVALARVTITQPGFADDPALRAAPDRELQRMVLDPGRPGTIAFAVERLVAAAQAVRDQLSGDTWPVLTTLERELLGRDDEPSVLAEGGRGPAFGRAALGPALTSLLALQGLGAESLVRDPSWRFLEVGRRLERAQQLLGLLRATLTGIDEHEEAVASLLLESVLVTAESVITYRRRYRSRAQLATVLDLLLLDADNPRALQWQLDRLTEQLPQLVGHPGEGRLTPVEEAVHAAASSLRTADLDGLTGDALDTFLRHVEGHLQRAAAELMRTVFRPVPASRPLVEERAGTAGDALLA